MERNSTLFLLFALASAVAIGEPLTPANTGGNPSFQIGVGFERLGAPATLEKTCQATLISHRKEGKNWICSMVTAAHCALGDSGTSAGITFFTADFGTLRQPVTIVKPGSYPGADDLAVIHFECKESARELVVEVADPPKKATDAMGLPIMAYAASAAFRSLFSATLPSNYSPEKKQIEMQLGSGEINGVRQTFATYSGDSGGGLFVRDRASGALELVGVISGGIHMLDQPLGENEEIPHEKGSDMTLFAADIDWIRSQIKAR